MATITSTQTGNWSATATWVGGVVPGDGDIAIVANGHTVTIDQDLGTFDGGGVTGIKLGTATTGNTAVLEFDAAANRTIIIGYAGYIEVGRGAHLNLVGSATYRLTIQPVSAGTYWSIYAPLYANVDKITLQYCDLWYCGTGTTVRAFSFTPNSATSTFNVQNCTLNYCGGIKGALNVTTYPTVDYNGDQVYPGVFAFNKCVGCTYGTNINAFFELSTPTGWTIGHNFFGTGSVPHAGSPIVEGTIGNATYGPNLVEYNVVHSTDTGSAFTNMRSPCTLSRNLSIRALGSVAGNGLAALSVGGTAKPTLVQANIIEGYKHNYEISGTIDGGLTVDGNFSLRPGDEDFYFPMIYSADIKNNIATGASQWMMIVYWDTILGNHSTDNLVHNNTFASPDSIFRSGLGFGRGVTNGEAYNNSAYNNIFYHCNTGIMSINSGSTYTLTDYNNFYLTNDNTNPDTLVGVNDLAVDPNFVDITRGGGVAAYDLAHGGTGTRANFIDRMWDGTYDFDSVYLWIYDGFVPQNPALQGTGLDGADIGAAAVVPETVPVIAVVSPASYQQGTTKTVSIGGSDLTGATVAISGTGLTLGTPTVAAGYITFTLTVAVGATLGARTLTVTTPGGVLTETINIISTAAAINYFIDPVGGSDSNSGLTITLPKLTLMSVRDSILPGGTIYLRGGDYTGSQGWYQQTNMGVHGTEAEPITIRNYPGEVPHFESTTAQYGIYFTLAKDWQILDGISFGFGLAKSVNINQGHHNIIRNCVFTGSRNAEITFDRADYNTVENCTGYNIGGDGGEPTYYGTGEFIFSFGGQYNIVQNNLVYSAGHAGMEFQDSQDHTRLSCYNIIRNNVVDNSVNSQLGYVGGGGGIYLGVQSHHNEVYDNVIIGVKGHPTITQPKAGLYCTGNDNTFTNNRVESYGLPGREDRGIFIASTTSGGSNLNTINNVITGNYVGPGYGIALYVREGEGTRLSGVNVADNTITGNTLTTPIEALTSGNFVGAYTASAKYPIYIGSYQDGAWPVFANGNVFIGTTFLKVDQTTEDWADTGVRIGYYYETGGWATNITTAYANYPAVFMAAVATAPVVTAFVIPATGNTLTIPVTTFTASTTVGITGWLITESATTPAVDATGWSTTAPTTYTAATWGVRTLHAWVKDALGTISASVSATTTLTEPVTPPEPVSGPLLVGHNGAWLNISGIQGADGAPGPAGADGPNNITTTTTTDITGILKGDGTTVSAATAGTDYETAGTSATHAGLTTEAHGGIHSIPAGGTTGQKLIKTADTDYATGWATDTDAYLPLTGGIIKPAANSTTTLQVQKADATPVLNVDTTNGRVGVGTATPTKTLDVAGVTQIIAGTNVSTTAPLVVQNTIPYGDASNWSQNLQIWKNSIGSSVGSMSAEGSLTIGSILTATRLAASYAGSQDLAAFCRSAGLGMFFPSDTAVAFTTASTERMRIDSTGNVGIGTTAPATKLHSHVEDASTATTTNVLTLSHDSSGTPTTGLGVGINLLADTSTTASQQIGNISGVWSDATYATRKGDLVFSTSDGAVSSGAATEKMRITSAGRVGIGTAAPAYALDASTGTIRSGLFVMGTAGSTLSASGLDLRYAGLASIGNSNTNIASAVAISSKNIEAVRIDPSQNVGIGTTTPATKLHSHVEDAGTTTAVNLLTLSHNTTGTADVGLGVGISALAESSTSVDQELGTASWKWTNPTHATLASKFVVQTRDNGGALADNLTLDGLGLLSVSRLFANSPTGFTGRLLQAQINGVDRFYVTQTGTGYFLGNVTVGGLQVANGTAATPSISTAINGTTGFFFNNAYIGQSIAGVEKARLDNNGDLTITGQLTTGNRTRHIQLDAKVSGNPAAQPTQEAIGSAAVLVFPTTGSKYAYVQWEIPSDWVPGTDILFEVDWTPWSGSMTGTDAVKWDVSYGTRAVGEAVNGTLTTVSTTIDADLTQYITTHSPVTFVATDTNNPLTHEDHIFIRVTRDTAVTNDFAGDVGIFAFEIIYTSNGIPET